MIACFRLLTGPRSDKNEQIKALQFPNQSLSHQAIFESTFETPKKERKNNEEKSPHGISARANNKGRRMTTIDYDVEEKKND